MERTYTLGVDIFNCDDILAGISFDDLIMSLQHTGYVDTAVAKRALKEMLEKNVEDMWFLFERNVNAIIAEAVEGRGQ